MIFYRKIERTIRRHFEANDDRILVIGGARQTGKSFIISKVCHELFDNVIEIDLQSDHDGSGIFSKASDTNLLYLILSSQYGDRLGKYGDTIVFLDEIQVYPRLLSMLKDLCKEKRYHFIASGSELGITLKYTFIPMGAIEERQMFPMDLEEFLLASSVGKDVIAYLRDCFDNLKPVDESIHDSMMRHFRMHLFSGGLPEAVNAFLSQDVSLMRNIHSMVFRYYKDDASKYDLAHKLKIERIYDMLPSYMENKVKRLQFKRIEGSEYATYSKYQDEFDYLISSGIALGVKAISDPKYPLKFSMAKNLIKLYYNDTGILCNIIFDGNINAMLDEEVNLGSVYETAVAVELNAHGHSLYYYDKRKKGEVDFLIDDPIACRVLPIEVKSGKDQISYRALPGLLSDAEYDIPKGIVLGNKNIVSRKGGIVTLPVYMSMFL